MGTPANIIIEQENDSFLLPKGIDKQLLFCSQDGYPFEFKGIVYKLIEAYYNLIKPPDYQLFNNLSMDTFASELIKISYLPKHKYYNINPASSLCYNQYNKEGYFIDSAYKYIVKITVNSNTNKSDATLTIKYIDNKIIKTFEEWNKVSKIVFKLVHSRHKHFLVEEKNTPCNDCVVRPMCIKKLDSEFIFAENPCDKLINYKK